MIFLNMNSEHCLSLKCNVSIKYVPPFAKVNTTEPNQFYLFTNEKDNNCVRHLMNGHNIKHCIFPSTEFENASKLKINKKMKKKYKKKQQKTKFHGFATHPPQWEVLK